LFVVFRFLFRGEQTTKKQQLTNNNKQQTTNKKRLPFISKESRHQLSALLF